MTTDLAAQVAEMTAAEESFLRMPDSATYRSTLYPRHSIMINLCATGPNALDTYLIYRDEERARFAQSSTFRGAVAAVMVDARRDPRTEADYNRAASEAAQAGQ